MKKGEETYQKVIDVSIYFFAKDGIHKTSFAKIADALNMTKPSLYYYVKSKEDLIHKVFNYIFDDYSFESYFEKSIVEEEELESYLVDGGLQFIKEIEERDMILNLLQEFMLYANRIEEKDASFKLKIKKAQQSFVKGFEDVLGQAVQYNLIEEKNIDLHAQTLALMLDSIQSYKMLGIDIDVNTLWSHTVRNLIKK